MKQVITPESIKWGQKWGQFSQEGRTEVGFKDNFKGKDKSIYIYILHDKHHCIPEFFIPAKKRKALLRYTGRVSQRFLAK